VAQIVREEMENAVALAAPLRVKVKVGERWSQMREVARNAS
jgi:DNA polymerase I-like protein with 3'-5' exonuclease and polymerase domains